MSDTSSSPGTARKASPNTSAPRNGAHPDIEDRTTEQRAADALKVGAPLVAAEIINGGPLEPIGTVKVPNKRKPGRPRGRTYEDTVSVPLDKELLDMINEKAGEQHLSKAAMIRALCRDALAGSRH